MLLIHDIYSGTTIVSHSVNSVFEIIVTAMYSNLSSNPSYFTTIAGEAIRQEEIWDKKACNWYVALQYQYSLMYASLIFLDIQQFGVISDSDYYDTKFELSDTNEKLACNKISLRKILTDFGIENILDL
jgi:hypothetical protein